MHGDITKKRHFGTFLLLPFFPTVIPTEQLQHNGFYSLLED